MPRVPLAPLALRLLVLASSTLPACGTTAKAVSEPHAEGEGASSAKAAGEGEGPPEPSGPRKPSCSDGTCFECGEGICPSPGFYCETSKPGAAARCAWQAPCVQKATCACLGPLTRGCSCEDRSGIAFVACGGG